MDVKRIAADLRETLESKAELYPAVWAACQVLEKAIAEEMPAGRPKRKHGYEDKPRRCVWSQTEQIKRLQHQLAYTRRTRKAAEADERRARKQARYSG